MRVYRRPFTGFNPPIINPDTIDIVSDPKNGSPDPTDWGFFIV